MKPEFHNEPFTNFQLPENKKAFQEALAKVESELGREYDLIIGGERIKTDKKSKSINPSNT
ncbi:MAG: L-glutamate gamma-semialdehyde dehydrogenase, partial [Clostridia bacterium]